MVDAINLRRMRKMKYANRCEHDVDMGLLPIKRHWLDTSNPGRGRAWKMGNWPYKSGFGNL